MPFGRELLVIVSAYLLGCVAAGYYLVRLRLGRDVRGLGSGNVGARNVGRVMGAPGFLVTLGVDFFKGAVAVWLAKESGIDAWAVTATMLAVVVGHIWPVQLQFRGGKGIATSIGAVLAFHNGIALVLALVFAAAWMLARNLTIAGLLAFAVTPLVVFLLGFPLGNVFGLSSLALLILVAHRKNIREELDRAIAADRVKAAKRAVSK